MILVVSHPEDVHATRVLALLREKGEDPLLFNLADLPLAATVTLRCETEVAGDFELGGQRYPLTAMRSAWWRRPQAPKLDCIADGEAHAFTHNEWQEAINGLWQVLDVPWMNPPARDEVAARKLLQLKVAAELGFRIPRTCITSDPEAARAFIQKEGVGRTIFKSFSCTHDVWRETRLVRERELDSLESVRLSPVIFQEYVPGVDLRITIVGHDVFAAAIHATETDYPTDFRMSIGQARVEKADLPTALVDSLRALMQRLGLIYGAVDMRRTDSGEYVFLEVNTAGEFLFVEERTGLPITAAIARWLAKPN